MSRWKVRMPGRLFGALAAVATVAVAVPALGLAGPPIVNGPYPETWCGAVGGTAVDTIAEKRAMAEVLSTLKRTRSAVPSDRRTQDIDR